MVTLLVTGDPRSGSGRIEIIKENFQTEVCNNMPKYPIEVSSAAGSHWKDGKLSICGGYNNDGSRISNCYLLDNGQWKANSNNLKTGRNGHAVSNIGNNIWFTGGYEGQSQRLLSSTEIMHHDGLITLGPNLPQARGSHCQVSYGHTTFIIGGDIDGSRTATVLKFDTNDLNKAPEQVESMLNERTSHACTIFNSALHDGRPLALVAGGYPCGSVCRKAEIWDYTKEGTSWEQVGDLPISIIGAKLTPTSKGDNVIMTHETSVYTLSILGSNYQWTKLSHDLSISRRYHAQALVPASTIQC